MYRHTHYLRARYAETDQMGYVYYGVYPTYFEVARTEAVRALGVPYTQMEAQGIMLPVVELGIRYKRPAQYDTLIRIETEVRDWPSGPRITFHHVLHNEADELLLTGHVTLAFSNAATRRPCRAPQYFLDALAPHWKP